MIIKYYITFDTFFESMKYLAISLFCFIMFPKLDTTVTKYFFLIFGIFSILVAIGFIVSFLKRTVKKHKNSTDIQTLFFLMNDVVLLFIGIGYALEHELERFVVIFYLLLGVNSLLLLIRLIFYKQFKKVD